MQKNELMQLVEKCYSSFRAQYEHIVFQAFVYVCGFPQNRMTQKKELHKMNLCHFFHRIQNICDFLRFTFELLFGAYAHLHIHTHCTLNTAK